MEHALIAYCGVDCSVCPDYKEDKCPGCRQTDWPEDDACLPVACCREKGLSLCGECADFPCAEMKDFYEESDSHRKAYLRIRSMALLSTDRLTVRPFRVEDANALFSILSDRSVMEYIEPPFSYEQTVDFLKQAGTCDPPLIYAAVRRADGVFLGHVIWHPYDESSYELGWVLGREHWGQGYADELTDALIVLARERGIPDLVIECSPDQPATIHIAEKHGFTLMGYEDHLAVYRLSLL